MEKWGPQGQAWQKQLIMLLKGTLLIIDSDTVKTHFAMWVKLASAFALGRAEWVWVFIEKTVF